MRLSDYRQSYYDYSGSASTVGRQAGFAGIALIWVFKIGSSADAFGLPQGLHIPTIAFITALALDLLQYVIATAIWGGYCRYKEKQFGAGSDESFEVPMYFNWPALACFWGKHTATICAYIFLLLYAVEAVKFVDTQKLTTSEKSTTVQPAKADQKKEASGTGGS